MTKSCEGLVAKGVHTTLTAVEIYPHRAETTEQDERRWRTGHRPRVFDDWLKLEKLADVLKLEGADEVTELQGEPGSARSAPCRRGGDCRCNMTSSHPASRGIRPRRVLQLLAFRYGRSRASSTELGDRSA